MQFIQYKTIYKIQKFMLIEKLNFIEQWIFLLRWYHLVYVFMQTNILFLFEIGHEHVSFLIVWTVQTRYSFVSLFLTSWTVYDIHLSLI